MHSGEDVWFESLSEEELAEHWSADDGSSMVEKLNTVQLLDTIVNVHIKLVGFSGEGNHAFRVTKVHLHSADVAALRGRWGSVLTRLRLHRRSCRST